MHETITAFVGLDAHAQSTAIGVAVYAAVRSGWSSAIPEALRSN